MGQRLYCIPAYHDIMPANIIITLSSAFRPRMRPTHASSHAVEPEFCWTIVPHLSSAYFSRRAPSVTFRWAPA